MNIRARKGSEGGVHFALLALLALLYISISNTSACFALHKYQ
jgi:hypothetical protein